MLHIDNSVFTALRKDKYSGYSFLKCNKQDLIQSGIALLKYVRLVFSVHS
jgi:hypothetical protein